MQYQRMDITSIIMIRLDTVERSSKEHRAVGYALVPVFMDSSGEQVDSWAWLHEILNLLTMSKVDAALLPSSWT